MTAARACMLVLTLALLAHDAHGDSVTRRGSEPTLTGTVTRVDDGGVVIRSESGAEHAVPWDRVREVSAGDPNIQRAVDQHRDVAERLWRARTRLERGDSTLAEPLFERLFAEYRGRSHETALLVAEGLLRCRLARSANDTALIPALETARLRRAGIRSPAYDMMPVIFDDATSLCMRLPPAWVSTAGLARVESELRAYDARGDTVVAAMASLYRAAVRRTLGLTPEPVPALAVDHPGVSLMRGLIACMSDDAAERSSARSAMLKRLADAPAWVQAWGRYALGQSLLMDDGESARETALVHLSHLPASFVREQPYLAAMALATMIVQLQRMGAVDEAAAMRAELTRMFPSHPALSMLDAAALVVNPSSASGRHAWAGRLAVDTHHGAKDTA